MDFMITLPVYALLCTVAVRAYHKTAFGRVVHSPFSHARVRQRR